MRPWNLVQRAIDRVAPTPLTIARARSRLASRPTSAPHVSPGLRAFTEELPLERRSILAFVTRCAAELSTGEKVLDAGAGDAPYRELFMHCEYVTVDWPGSVHEGGRGADIVASLEALPIDDQSFDAVLCTQVLEHVAQPRQVLGELHRILRPDGRLFLTVPLVWPLHEEPYDYFRYTSHGLTALLTGVGFTAVRVDARNGYFATMAQLLDIAPDAVGAGGGRGRRRLFAQLRRLAVGLAELDALDERRIFPLGYEVTARRSLQSVDEHHRQ